MMALPVKPGDTNVGFILTMSQRIQIGRLLDGFVEGLSQSSSVLIDRAGRIAEIARKPVGVNLHAISALAAGCFATTHELAQAMGENEYSLLFQHENEQQVYIWPVADRALLVVLLRGMSGVQTLEDRLAGSMGLDLVKVVKEAQEPPKTVPPPRVIPPEIPAEVRHRTRALTALIMDLQARRPQDFTPDVNTGLLRSREQLVQALTKRDWRKAWEICEGTRQWLLMQMKLPHDQDAGQVLSRLYKEVIDALHGVIMKTAAQDRTRVLYLSFFRFLSKKWPQIYSSDRFISMRGVDVAGMWETGLRAVPDPVRFSAEFIPAMDALVRELLRVIYLSKGKEGREAAIADANKILDKYKLELLPFGLESAAGREWTLIFQN
jgi:predicted regulator of Ras-like GTPase activity (Roadblock/LC7/MglB family)